MVFSGPSKPPPRWPMQKRLLDSISWLKTSYWQRMRRWRILGMQRKKVEMAKYVAGTISHSQSRSMRLQRNHAYPSLNRSIRNTKSSSYLYIHTNTDTLQEERGKPLFDYIITQDKYMEDDEYNYEDYNQSYEGQQEEDPSAANEHSNFNHDPHMDEEQPFQILPLIRLYSELNQILEEIQGLVCLDKGWCLILLKDFKWDKDYLREEFYNRNEEYLTKAGFVPGLDSPLDFDRGQFATCEVCCVDQLPLYYNICGHRYCIECWMSHLKNSIQSGTAFPRCMDFECGRPVLQETITGFFNRYGEEGALWLKKYEKKVCELFITTNRNYQFCTGVDCGNCIKMNTQVDTVECNCGKVFCFRCQSDDHYPCKCAEKAKWVEQVMKEEADAKWISQNAKICPWCKKAVERSMGCNFMACMCGKSFCYMCSKPWEPDHKDHFKCHIFKKKPDDEVNREREVMQRMNHCTERYVFNQAVANSYKEIDVFAKRKYLFKTLHIDLTESEFMENAYRFTVECCEKLKWIYAFTYFYDLKQGKEAFEFCLGEYERYKENLLKLLAVDLKKFFTRVEEFDSSESFKEPLAIDQLTEEFRGLKKQIVNYYTCTKNFKEKFVEEVKFITEKLDEEKEKSEMENYQKESREVKLESKEDNLQRKKSKKSFIEV